METSFFMRKSSSVCSLNFPRPHQLGISTGVQSSRSFHSSFIQSDYTLAAAVGTEDVDSAGPPPTKKVAIAKKRKITPSVKPGVRPKPVVKSYDEKPLKEFSLFLPERVPGAILHSRSAIQEFVLSTTTTYLSLWELSSKMDALELRIPPLYVDQLCDDGDFLTKFFAEVFRHIPYVKSIQELILPRIVMHPHIQIEAILKPLADSKCAISHLYVPITCSLHSKDVAAYDFKSLTVFLAKSSICELTFVSSNDIVEEIVKHVEGELKKMKRSTLHVDCSKKDLGAPGPDYIADMKATTPIGEVVNPHVLVDSLNASVSAAESVGQGPSRTRRSGRKSVSIKIYLMISLT